MSQVRPVEGDVFTPVGYWIGVDWVVHPFPKGFCFDPVGARKYILMLEE